MPARILLLMATQLLGLAIGHGLFGPWGAAAGAVLGALAWLLRDMLQASRLLRWLQQGAGPEPPALRGVWQEALQRMRKLLRLAGQERAASDRRLQDFLDAVRASPNGVALLDARDRIEYCNLTSAQHLGFDPQRDLMQQVGNLVRDPTFTACLNGRDRSASLVIPGREHSDSHPVRISVLLHPYGEGRRLLLTRDVTALEQAEAMRRDFVANVSHEIRTPLTVLSGFVETLQTLDLTEKEHDRYLNLMRQQTDRMQTLVDDLLMLSRLEGTPSPAQGQWFDLKTVLQRCESDARAMLAHPELDAEGSHELLFEMPQGWEGQAQIDGSAGELHSAFFNLISNAIRYTPPGGSVRVSWHLNEFGAAVFSVRDDGPGIAPEHLPRLTERFYRVDQSRSRQTGGTGLGLAIVKHVAQRHGARLLIESTPGKGSTFSIEIPAQRFRLGLGVSSGLQEENQP